MTRRQRFVERFPGTAVFGSGLARIRNFTGNQFPFRSESHFLYFIGCSIEGALLRFEGGKVVLFAAEPTSSDALWHGRKPSLEELSVTLGLEVRPTQEFSVERSVAVIAPDDTETAIWLEQVLDREVEAGSAISVDGADASLADVMVTLRSCQDSWAVGQLEQAIGVTAAGFEAGFSASRGARREAEIRASLESAITARGMSTAYQSIVTVRGEVLHNHSSGGLIKPGDLLLADVGAETPEGWAADVTRTWPVSGRFEGLQRDIYQAVLDCQFAAIEVLAPGVKFVDVHRTAAVALLRGLVAIGLFKGEPEQLLADGAAALFFPHGLGHLLGLDVHDMEDLGDRAGYDASACRSTEPGERFLRLNRELKVGMVVTIEPGFYCIDAVLAQPELAGRAAGALQPECLKRVRQAVRGIRIEDDVLITQSGSRVLTANIPKTISDVERMIT